MDENFLTQLTTERNNLVLSRTNQYSSEIVKKILEKVQEKYSFDSPDQAKAAIAVIFQQGGTANRCDGNMTIKIFDKTVKLSDLRKIIAEHGSKKGERKLARTLASEIRSICLALQIPGNLAQKIRRTNPGTTISQEDCTWLSDFQSLNTDCPSEFRKLIETTFKSTTTQQQTQSKK